MRARRLSLIPPRTRADCASGPRPCPWSRCRYHIKASDASCALDVAELGGLDNDKVAALLGMPEHVARDLTRVALRKLARKHWRLLTALWRP